MHLLANVGCVMDDDVKTVAATWPFEGTLTMHVENNDQDGTVLLEVHRPDGQYLNVTVPKAEFMLAVKAADGDLLAAHHLRFLRGQS